MQLGERGYLKSIIDREKLIRFKTCAGCRRPFNLGDPVVLACGDWDGPPRLIHENEAVFDADGSRYVERKHSQASRDA